MKANRSRFSSLWALVLGGLLAAAPLVARAAQPATAAEADQRAQEFAKRADNFKFQGGALWKTGNVQRAEANAANCTEVANAMRGSTYLVVAAPADEAMSSDSGVAFLVRNNQPAPESPKCPAP